MITMSIFNTFVRRNEILRSHATRTPGMFYLCGKHQLSESRIGSFILLSSGTRFNFEQSRKGTSQNSATLEDKYYMLGTGH